LAQFLTELTPPAYQPSNLLGALSLLALRPEEGDLILRSASRLDAFSAYPVRT